MKSKTKVECNRIQAYNCFTDFLMSRGIFFKFFTNYTGPLVDLVCLPPVDFICATFNWFVSDEGSAYWSKINKLWVEYYFNHISK
ncbi:hypothetical protein [Dipodfec virus UOA04_Rod_660]|nr:hypothetical protein [Dipodfec virus UOA04_Rod_660]